MQKVDNPEFEAKVLDLLNETKTIPVSVDFVAYHLQIHWTTAKALLLIMAVKGQIRAIKTTKSFVFCLMNFNGGF